MDIMYRHRDIGIYSYLSTAPGIGGKLRKRVEDFFVEEKPIDIPRSEHGKNLCVKVKLRNWETNRFVKILSKNLGISRKRVRFTGMKDKRAISIQLFCILNFPEGMELPHIRDVEYLEVFRTDYILKIGDLIGNRFRIVVSDAICDDRIRKIEGELNGVFPNYFGVQRFGASRPIGHIVGRFIVKRDFENAVRYYVGYPDIFNHDEGRRIFFESLNAKEALKKISVRAEYERAMLNHLVSNSGDYIGALRSIPVNLLQMFVHAYQAYLFNRMVSERVRIGIEPEIGDIVMKTENGKPVEKLVRVTDFNLSRVREKIQKGEAYISTVLVGYNTSLSGGIQGDIERRIMEEEDIMPSEFKINEIPEVSTRGRRRNILAPFMNFKNEGCIFTFTLYAGSYATSLMREFMKVENLANY